MSPPYTEIVPEELDLFANRSYLTCIEHSDHREITPQTTLSDATSLEFNCLGSEDEYKDLSWIFLKLRLKIVKADGTNFTNDDTNQPTLVTNGLHSLFKSAHISLNSTQLRSIESSYAYKVKFFQIIIFFLCFYVFLLFLGLD